MNKRRQLSRFQIPAKKVANVDHTYTFAWKIFMLANQMSHPILEKDIAIVMCHFGTGDGVMHTVLMCRSGLSVSAINGQDCRDGWMVEITHSTEQSGPLMTEHRPPVCTVCTTPSPNPFRTGDGVVHILHFGS